MKRIFGKIGNRVRRIRSILGKAKRFNKKYGFEMTTKRIVSVIASRGKNLATQLEDDLDRESYANLSSHPTEPISILVSDNKTLRLNLVTDSIGAESLFGGVATALIIANEFAKKNHCELRIITRNSVAHPEQFRNLLDIYGIEPAKKVSFYNDVLRNTHQFIFKLEIGVNDIFMATSWWSAKAISETTIRERFFYIVQEVETFFYPYGIEHYLATQVFESKQIDFIVNSKYLFNYFEKHYPNITKNGVFFEPAFSSNIFYPREDIKSNPSEKHKLFFYARPNNPRNLYTYGLHILNTAISIGIIDTKIWDIYFAGQNTPAITFDNGYHPIRLNRLSLSEYAKFIRSCDLAFSLMYTPHPSYPPLDFAASGGVVLTNKFECKEKMSESKNIVLADLDEKSMFTKLSEAVNLSLDYETRVNNIKQNQIEKDWGKTLLNVLDYMNPVIKE